MASFIVLKNKVLWSRLTDSHTEIRREFKLRDDYREDVKVEITPPDKRYDLPLDKWIFKTDNDGRDLPEWWDRKDAEKRCRVALKSWAEAKIIRNKNLKSANETHVRIYIGCKIGELKSSGASWFCGSSTCQTNSATGESRFYDNSKNLTPK